MSLIQQISQDLKIYQASPFMLELMNERSPAKYYADKVIEALAKRAGMNQEIKVEVMNSDLFGVIAYAAKSEIILPPLYLIDRKDIPFTGPDDPQLNNNQVLQQFSEWISSTFNLPKKVVNIKDRLRLKLFLKMLEKPEEAKKSYQFILLHELGHIALNHEDKENAFNKKMKMPLYLMINIFTLGMFALIGRLKLSQSQEKEADAFACKHSTVEMAQGGKHLFEITRNFRSKNFSETLLHLFFCTMLALTHTSLKARSRRIEQHLLTKN